MIYQYFCLIFDFLSDYQGSCFNLRLGTIVFLKNLIQICRRENYLAFDNIHLLQLFFFYHFFVLLPLLQSAIIFFFSFLGDKLLSYFSNTCNSFLVLFIRIEQLSFLFFFFIINSINSFSCHSKKYLIKIQGMFCDHFLLFKKQKSTMISKRKKRNMNN